MRTIAYTGIFGGLILMMSFTFTLYQTPGVKDTIELSGNIENIFFIQVKDVKVIRKAQPEGYSYHVSFSAKDDKISDVKAQNLMNTIGRYVWGNVRNKPTKVTIVCKTPDKIREHEMAEGHKIK